MAGEKTGTGTSARGTEPGARGTDQRALYWRLPEGSGVTPQAPASKQQTWSGIENSSIGTEQYVDVFKEVVYDLYETPDGKNLSKSLHVYYEDGTNITININHIGDELTVPLVKGEEFFFIGPGGRVFPKRMARGTTPNLWQAKRRALIVI